MNVLVKYGHDLQSSAHARDTAQLSPGVGGGHDQGVRTAWHGKAGRQECRKARCFFFAITVACGS